ncbi:MAG: DMT family transporter [Butyrivibrio sp.]|nr:DMT family transporter [Butyrivibrio sp.]
MNNKIVQILILQFAVMIYSINTVVAKFVSNEEFLSPKFLMLYFLEFCVLGVYAIFWQQLIKRFELSIAYANKAMTLLWSMLWSIVIFHEGVTLPKIAGVILVIIGTIVINGGDSKDSTESSEDTEAIQTEAGTDKEAK